MLAQGRKGTASVCTRDKLWRRTGRTGGAQRICGLINFLKGSLGEREPPRRRFRSGPFFMWTEIPKENREPVQSWVISLGVLEKLWARRFVFPGTSNLEPIILSFRSIYGFCVFTEQKETCPFRGFRLEAYSDPNWLNPYSCHRPLLPLVWSLLFTFKRWIKEFQTQHHKKRRKTTGDGSAEFFQI